MTGSSKSLPARPSLEFHKKQAKARVESGEFPRHAAALYAIAKEHGFSSWPVMKAFILARRLDDEARLAEVVRAACSNDVRAALALLSVEPELARRSLHAACAFGEFETVRAWLARDAARVNENGGPNGWPPLLYACFSRVLRVDSERGRGIEAAVDLLLEAGADANSHYLSQEHGGVAQTALYGAAGIANNPRITRALLEHGADPSDSESLYHVSEFRDTSCLRLLLEAKPDPKWLSYCFRRMLDHPNEAGALLFLEHGADPGLELRPDLRPQLHQAVFMFRSARTIEALLDRGADPNHEFEGKNAYRLAVRFGREDVAALLAARGASTAGVSDEDRAVGACFAGQAVPRVSGTLQVRDALEQAAARGELAIVRALLELGPSVDTLENRSYALLAACWGGRGPVARFLLERGVDFSYRNEHGGDALQTVRHGSVFCQDTEGGPGTKLPEEAHPGDYAEIARCLFERGFPVPPDANFGSLAVREVLRAFGAEDRE